MTGAEGATGTDTGVLGASATGAGGGVTGVTGVAGSGVTGATGFGASAAGVASEGTRPVGFLPGSGIVAEIEESTGGALGFLPGNAIVVPSLAPVMGGTELVGRWPGSGI